MVKPYVRKTVDLYDILGDYGGGFEIVNCESSRKAARDSIREYRENEPTVQFKIKKYREKIA